MTGVDQLSGAVLGATEQLAPFWVSRPFEPGPADPLDGTPLVIDLPPSSAREEKVRVHYQSTPAAPGLHWSGTRPGGGGKPFFYAVSQPFGARGWIPLPDTPRARMTFRIHVHTPADMVALLSGAREQSAAPRGAERAADHWLHVDRPVAGAALDLIVADLAYAPIGPADGVYAPRWSARSEARALDAAPAVRAAGDRLVGGEAAPHHVFVVMPPDFARAAVVSGDLTLLSPTELGDAPHLVPLAARLPYAAAAALLPPAGRRDRWIGQAFAAYLQSRIIEALYGEASAQVSDALAIARLQRALAFAPPAAQALEADPAARAAGPGGGSIPYDKGRLLLRFLEAGFGRARFDAFMRAFIAQHAGRPVSTADFVAAVDRDLRAGQPLVLRAGALDAWIRDPGLPQSEALPDAEALRPVDAARTAWLAGRTSAAALGAARWPAEYWTRFLSALPPTVSAARLAELDAAYAPMRSGDAAREALWLELAVRASYAPALDAASRFLAATGRIDLIVPLYAQLMRSPQTAALARRVYSGARPGYDPLAVSILDPILGKHGAGEADADRDAAE